MRNSVFVALFIAYCAYQMCRVSGQNCTAPGQKPPFSNACMFICIENLYDQHFCNVCSKNAHPINLNRNETLESILPYNFVRYDEQKGSIISLPSCSGCLNKENASAEHTFIEYVQPEELLEFYALTHNLTVKSHHTNIVNDTIVQSVHELYTNLTNRFDETKQWCVNALGIEKQYNKFKVGNASEAGTESHTPSVDIIDEATTVIAPTNRNSETSESSPTQSSVPSNPMENDDHASLITTEMPEPSTVQVQNDTSKMQNMSSLPDAPALNKNDIITMKANKPLLHDHHFHHSVTIITAVSLILLSILIVSIAVIAFYVNRHKNMGAHLTSSRTYVFDQQH